jgi:pyruvate/2-oxoglutarate dehydrogenase complex dihydrolipoamide dehydrogenase (E3) component
VGCIPSKAFIHAAGKFEAVKKAASGGTLGITAGSASIDLAQTTAWKDGIVAKLNGGVGGLLKRAKGAPHRRPRRLHRRQDLHRHARTTAASRSPSRPST